jgi:Ser/Thr protein kinase RdoA (MazF antagonist)
VIAARHIPVVPRPSRISSYVTSRMGAPAIEPAQLRAVLERYELGSAGSGQNLRFGRRSRNVVVSTRAGARFVKQYRPQWHVETVRYGHSILLRLQDVRFPASHLARMPDGATWTTVGDGLFAVFEFVRGRNYTSVYLRRSDRMELTRVAAATLARMHRTLDGFVPEGRHHLALASPTGGHIRDVAWHAAKLEELRGCSETLEDPEAVACASRLTDVSGELLDAIAELEGRLVDAPLPRLVIHGDYGLHNVIFPSRDLAVPVDFEVARLDWRVNDLISALGKHRFATGEYDVAAMECFLAGYTPGFPLTRDELDLLADAWRLYRLRAAVQYWNSYFETGGPTRKLRSALQAVDQARWIADHPEATARLGHVAQEAAA